MIIDLTQSVLIKDYCKVSAIGDDITIANQVIFSFSREALVGFATELLWLYDDISDKNKRSIVTNPLKIDPAPNQAIGFYITPSSPTFVLKVNSLMQKEDEKCCIKDIKEISIRNKNINEHYHVKFPSEENEFEKKQIICLETYELSRRNIVDIKIVNKNGDDVSNCFSAVTMEINRKGIKALQTMLFVWANNCNEGYEYLVCKDGVSGGNNLGILLTNDSISTKMKMEDLGTIYNYDSRM